MHLELTDLIEALPAGLAITDRAGGLVLCNGRYRALAGSAVRTLDDAKPQDTDLPEKTISVRDLTEGDRRTLLPTSARVETAEGSWLQIERCALRAGFDLAILTDITEQVRHQARLIAARDRAEAANAARAQFLASLTHELRTPLNSIIGFAEIIGKELLGPADRADYRDYAELIREGGTHLLSLVNDLLDLSKAEAGKLEVEEAQVDLVKLAARCLEMVHHTAARAGIELRNGVPDDLPLVVAEERRLRQILLNLLSNAIKFSFEGGEVALTAAVVEGGLTLSVIDQGIGIAEGDIPRILEPFGQVAGSQAGHGLGTGLGLSLTKRLIELHGGAFEIESTLGGGTRTTVLLPEWRVVAR